VNMWTDPWEGLRRSHGRRNGVACASHDETIHCFHRVLLRRARAAFVTLAAAEPPPLRTRPTERQLRWHAMEFYGFLHFTVNTFTDKEWLRDESPAVFHPTDFDADRS